MAKSASMAAAVVLRAPSILPLPGLRPRVICGGTVKSCGATVP
jgi:hypothetical protein